MHRLPPAQGTPSPGTPAPQTPAPPAPAPAPGPPPRRPPAADVVLAAAVAVPAAALDAVSYDLDHLVVSLGLTVPLAWRRAAPVASAALVALFALLEVVSVGDFLVANVAVLLAVHALAAHAPRRAALAGGGLALAGAVLAGAVFFGDDPWSQGFSTAAMALLVLAAAGAGLAPRLRGPGAAVQPAPGQDDSRLTAVLAWLREHVVVVDGALAGLLALVLLPLGAGLAGTGGLVASAGLLAPLAWRRAAPVTSAAVVAAFALLELVLSEQFLGANVAVLVAVYSLAAYAPRWARTGGLVLALAGAVLAGIRYGMADVDPAAAAFVAGGCAVSAVAAHALGVVRRVRLQQVGQLAERARLLEVEREQESRLAATSERQRIAREMHDVVAHSLSVIIAQADGGRYAGRTDPAAAVEALGTIASTGRQALTDMRSLLGVLRQEPGSELLPQPDAGRIPELVESVRRSGLDVELRVEGEPRALPAGAGLAAYRIVQESLTNVLKHAGPAGRAAVLVRWEPQLLRLAVVDDGRGAAAAGGGRGGQGIRGMQERAQLHGGRLLAAPRPGGGFEVQAELPYPRGS